MKWILTTLLLVTSSAFAQIKFNRQSFGLGALLGDPTAISFKGHLGNLKYIDAALAYNVGPADDLYMHGDYLMEKQNAIEVNEDVILDLYFGIGARAYFADNKKKKSEFYLGPRAPIGLTYYMKDPSVEFFGELALILDIVPETEADLDFSIGARYWF